MTLVTCTFFVTFFSATIDGRDLIFGHKLHKGTPYRGKRFWIHQIPTSCLPTVDFYTHWTYILYMPIFSHIFLSNYWWQKSDIWSQASYRYPISWEAFLDPSDSYFLFAEEWGYHKWALAHSSSCFTCELKKNSISSAIWLKSHISLFWYVVACEWPYVITFTIQWKWRLADMKTL
jgi:hypothetical protein